MSDQEWLTVNEAAARAGISPARIRQLVHKRQVAFKRSTPGAHDTRIDPRSLATWQAQKTRGRPRQATIPRQLAPAAPVYSCVCCGQALARRRGRPPKDGARCIDCVIAGCAPGVANRRCKQ